MFSRSINATIGTATLVMVLSTLSAQAGSRDAGNEFAGQGQIGSMAVRGSADSNPTPHPSPVQPTVVGTSRGQTKIPGDTFIIIAPLPSPGGDNRTSIVHPEFIINPDSMLRP